MKRGHGEGAIAAANEGTLHDYRGRLSRIYGIVHPAQRTVGTGPMLRDPSRGVGRQVIGRVPEPETQPSAPGADRIAARYRKSQPGQALVETGLAIALFTVVVLGIIEFGYAFMALNVITQAA